MSTNPISLHSHARFVSQLFSLTGPRENLPKRLSEILNKDIDKIRQNLQGSVEFTNSEIALISDSFKHACLFQKTA
jgi:hypothetical protein